MAPKDFKELEDMMEFAINLKAPVVIRYPRGGEDKEKFITHRSLKLKKSEPLTIGEDVTILAIGNQVSKAMNIFRELKKININAEVINARFLKPFDILGMLNSVSKTRFVVTLEDNTLVGGLGTQVKDLIAERKLQNIIIRSFGYPDVFVEHGTPKELEEAYGLDEKTIVKYIKNTILYKKNKSHAKLKNRKVLK